MCPVKGFKDSVPILQGNSLEIVMTCNKAHLHYTS